VGAILLLGFLMGMRHALEADHLAAVASLTTQAAGPRQVMLRGALWGLGHTATLLLVGGICLALDWVIPDRLAHAFELAVGVMLLGLGIQVLWRVRQRRVHLHVHRHGDGAVHLHAHRHLPGEPHDPADHTHLHPGRLPGKAFAVGLVHGLAGSAALLLITLRLVHSLWLGLIYIGLFGAGSVLGMAVLSLVIAVPLQFTARRLSSYYTGLETAIGIITLGVGLGVLYRGLR
jgi:ABC-type nickel/cobalt efflux system permease component RcnA